MNRKFAFSLMGVVLLALLVLLIYQQFSKADSMAFDSCVRSIHRNVIEAQGESSLRLIPSDEWTELEADNRKRLEERTIFGDCHQLESNRLVDIWGVEIRILYRSISPSNYEFRVWSTGSDRKSHTNDDIISPFGTLDTVKDIRWPE